MKKLYSLPTLEIARRNDAGGIQQIVINTSKYLSEFEWELTENINAADLIAYHATDAETKCHVLHCHGLYPTGEPGYMADNWQREANRRIINAAKFAKLITVPSQWVADIFRRDMHIDPVVIQWAVDKEVWAHDGTHRNYVLWNKNRTEGVCTPQWLNKLAQIEKGIQFVTTFGDKLPNVHVTGALSHSEMIPFVKNAAVYLATTKETGDIGSREALAAGVPVLAFRQGATPDFIIHGYNGFLAEYGDFEGLRAGLHWCLRNRNQLSQNALESAKDFNWQHVAKQFADVYDRASLITPNFTKISVVIPCYNYQNFLAQAIESVLSQNYQDFEIIVVDDCSTDNSALIARQYSQVKLIQLSENRGVAYARNYGIEHAQGDFIACLDADDMMEQGFLEICSKALQYDSTLGIVYTGLTVMGSNQLNAWPTEFNYQFQMQRENRIPSLCMFRKEAWARAGGFRQYMAPTEDADLWTRIVALGYGARQVTKEPLHIYRVHQNSASSVIRRGNKKEPFRLSVNGYRGDGMAAPGGLVHNYDNPIVTIIIEESSTLQRAIDSVEAQTFKKWEIVIIQNTDKAIETKGVHFIGKFASSGEEAIEKAEGVFIVWLKEGDSLHPEFLEKALVVYRTTGRYIYSDRLDSDDNVHLATEFNTENLAHSPIALIPKSALIGQTSLSFLNLLEQGVCGTRIPEPLVRTDRLFTGSNIMCSCKEKKTPVQLDQQEAVKVQYNGLPGTHAIVGIATHKNYGRHKKGDVFYIFKKDFDVINYAEPGLYVQVPEVEMPQNETLVPSDL